MGAAAADASNDRMQIKVWCVLVVVQICYCLWHVLAKKALNHGMDPLVLALYRELIACALMHSMAFCADKRPAWTFLRRTDGEWPQHVFNNK